jgi:hypothetical protein
LLDIKLNVRASRSFDGMYKITTIKDQRFFFGSFLILKFFIPKFMKIRYYLEIFITFGSGFQIELTIDGSSFNLICVSMTKLECF